MSACHDPYRELEDYLEKAQEEIWQTFEELSSPEEESLPSLYPEDYETYFRPPVAFRSPSHVLCNSLDRRTRNVAGNTLRRVCFDGNVVDLEKCCNISKYQLWRPFSRSETGNPNSKMHLESHFATGLVCDNCKHVCNASLDQPKTYLHASLSNPEDLVGLTDHNLILLNGHADAYNELVMNGTGAKKDSKIMNGERSRFRQRSYSESSSPNHFTFDDHYNQAFPRPPSGDVNLLSIWADNLVLEIEKTFNGDLDSSFESSNSSFDRTMSPTNAFDSNVCPMESKKILLNNAETAKDPNTSETVFLLQYETSCETGGIDFNDCLTPPPPDFEDKADTSRRKNNPVPDITNTANPKTSSRTSERKNVHIQLLNSGDSFTESFEDEVNFANKADEIHVFNKVIPCSTLKLDEKTDVKTTVASWSATDEIISNDTLNYEQHTEVQNRATVSNCSEFAKNSVEIALFPSIAAGQNGQDKNNTNFVSVERAATLPRDYANFTEPDRYCCSVPREASRNHSRSENSPILPQRSSSSSAVSSLSQVSMDELAAFMWKVKTSTYHPPPRADVCIDTKDNQTVSSCDAVTQTTPIVPLSRSSSFTWVNECDCSEKNLVNYDGLSEDCSCRKVSATCKVKTSTSASKSIDDDVFDSPQNSDASSLHLSACSVTSSSSTEDTVEAIESEVKNCSPQSSAYHEASSAGESTFSSPKLVSSVGTLVNIPEEIHATNNETMSLKSATSSISDTMGSASFPSTLKSKKSRDRHKDLEKDLCRNQPIEANVLILNDTMSISAPVLRLRHLNRKPQASSTESSPSEETPKGSFEKAPDSQSYNSAKELIELQAIEACAWLRAAGFPQYAQMYEDNLFPIDICTAQRDHAFLHPDSIQSLFRRLNTLNRCARVKFADTSSRRPVPEEESDDEEQCALSENWQFQRGSRRWSRVPSPTQEGATGDSQDQACAAEGATASPTLGSYATPVRKYLTPEEAYCSSHDSIFADEHNSSPDCGRRSLRYDDHYAQAGCSREGGHSPGSSSGSGGTISLGTEDMLEKPWHAHSKHLHRSGSDRIKDGAKALFRRMESLKGKRKKKVILKTQSEKTRDVFTAAGFNSGTDGSPGSSLAPSPRMPFRIEVSSPTEPGCSHEDTPSVKPKKKIWGSLQNGERVEIGAHSDSECSAFVLPDLWGDGEFPQLKLSKQKSALKKVQKPKNFKDAAQVCASCSSPPQDNKTRSRSSSRKEMPVNRTSHYDNLPAPLAMFNEACVESLDRDDFAPGKANGEGTSGSALDHDDGDIIIINNERRDSGVGASLTRVSGHFSVPWHTFLPKPPPMLKSSAKNIPITNLSAPQILVLRKLSLLKLTTLMEKFSPSSRTGWSWVVPKFIRRIRTPDYKDKAVFGLPLLVILQRTGYPLPTTIQGAIEYLERTAIDSTGIFRKSGVRSRIQKLKIDIESNPEEVNFEEQQPYDVADMLKQYFRELPEALLTNKLSETFISIFQHIPEAIRLEAVQAAVLLMPDENREVLQSLLCFLQEVSEHSTENQMTATNIAVCFAPSLFHLSSPRSASASPRRRKTVGAPDLKELNENRAAYECLACMVLNYRTICSVPKSLITKSRLPCMDNYEPATIEELSSLVHRDACGWTMYIECCIHTLIKESKEKYKGWINMSISDHTVDLAYKKLGDGHPLRLWKLSTEVEAPPTELLNRILRERQIWDPYFAKWKVVQILNKQTEVYQYVQRAESPHPPCDYCIIRSWKTDLPKGACVLIEASVDHPDAHLMVDGVRAVIMASRFLIEHSGSGKSRITYITRVDTRGRSPEWYNRAYGHICALNLIRLRDSFTLARTEGPETKV